MFGASKADNVFGQVVICLRMSKLDYMIKETYVTIRKKFVKSANKEVIEEEPVNRIDDLDIKKVLEKENGFLKEKIKEIETNFAILKVENEEMDIMSEVLEKDKDSLEHELDEANTESMNLKKNIDNLKKSKK